MSQHYDEENSAVRLHDVFFYGLYMDQELILAKGAVPRNQRKAKVDNYVLKVGKLATLLRKKGASTPGIIYALTHNEIDLLYRKAGLTQHWPEALIAELESGEKIPVLCCNLVSPPEPHEVNEDYVEKLNLLKKTMGLV